MSHLISTTSKIIHFNLTTKNKLFKLNNLWVKQNGQSGRV
jgi:hypothetical protein